jgi:hypothetical protein
MGWYDWTMVVFYTFRTFPWIDQLPKDTFVFGTLKQDLAKFCTHIENNDVTEIIGVAKSPFTYSVVDQYAQNRFNNSLIVKGGTEGYELNTSTWSFKVRQKPTRSFCNYVAYNISRQINEKDLPQSLIHICEKDIQILLSRI